MESGNGEYGVPKAVRSFPATGQGHRDQIISEPIIDVDGRDHPRQFVVICEID